MSLLSWLRAWLSDDRPERQSWDDRAAPGRGRPIQAGYAASIDTEETAGLWAYADALDADAANSLSVRAKLRTRMRKERSSNAHAAGILLTHTNYVVGTGPTLRMQTGSAPFNAMVETRWGSWCKAIGFVRKLRTLHLAKTADGEGIARLYSNPALADLVKLDLRPIETDQMSTGYGLFEPNHVDGVWFDEFGNPTAYDFLLRHPGALGIPGAAMPWVSEKVPARYVLHWFRGDRPGQHRGVPELTPSLLLFAQGRRFREAVVGAAETAADYSVIMKMPVGGEGTPDEADPFATLAIEKRMFVATPAGADPYQMRAEQPSTTYEGFNRSIVSEEARPLNMPYSIAAADSVGISFSGGRLDQLGYYVFVENDRDDAESQVLDQLFAVWFVEACAVYGWNQPAEPAPRHAWDWPARPEIDSEKTANARKIKLSSGQTTLTAIHAEDGLDWEDELQTMARDFRKTPEEICQRLFETIFAEKPASGPPPPPPPAEEPPPPARNGSRYTATTRRSAPLAASQLSPEP